MASAEEEKDAPVKFDQDSVWKEMLDYYFEDFVAFFFPAAYTDIDWSQPYEFFDKELEKVVRDSTLGRRLADKLVKVYLSDGTQTWLLIHIEGQSSPDREFAERMYVYNYRIFDRYHQEVISLAVLTDASENYRPTSYAVRRWGFEQSFNFPIVKLIDYNSQWESLEANQNPFAIVVMAHIKILQLRGTAELLTWKLRLVRMLYERGYERQQILELFRFLDWLIVLPAELKNQFETELDIYKGGMVMPYVTTYERRGIRKGMLAIILPVLKQKLGEVDASLEAGINRLSKRQLEELGASVLNISTSADLTSWLDKAPLEEDPD